jgi:hypothetical protein
MSKLTFWCIVAAFFAYLVGWGLELTIGEIVRMVEAPIVVDSEGFVIPTL